MAGLGEGCGEGGEGVCVVMGEKEGVGEVGGGVLEGVKGLEFGVTGEPCVCAKGLGA